MKRLICLLMIVLMGIPTISVAEETIDVSSISDEALLSLKEEVDDEILARGLVERSVLPAGIYIVGQDIKEGNYRLFGKDRYVEIFVFTDEAFNAYVENGLVATDRPEANPKEIVLVDPNNEGFVGLEEGEVMRLAYPCYIEEIDEPWMP